MLRAASLPGQASDKRAQVFTPLRLVAGLAELWLFEALQGVMAVRLVVLAMTVHSMAVACAVIMPMWMVGRAVLRRVVMRQGGADFFVIQALLCGVVNHHAKKAQAMFEFGLARAGAALVQALLGLSQGLICLIHAPLQQQLLGKL